MSASAAQVQPRHDPAFDVEPLGLAVWLLSVGMGYDEIAGYLLGLGVVEQLLAVRLGRRERMCWRRERLRGAVLMRSVSYGPFRRRM